MHGAVMEKELCRAVDTPFFLKAKMNDDEMDNEYRARQCDSPMTIRNAYDLFHMK